MKIEIININYHEIQEVLRVTQNRWSCIKIDAGLIYQYVEDVKNLMDLSTTEISNYELCEVVYHPCVSLYTISELYYTCFKLSIQDGRYYLVDVYLKMVSVNSHCFHVSLGEPDFLYGDSHIYKDDKGNGIIPLSQEILSFSHGRMSLVFDYKIDGLDALKKFIRSFFFDIKMCELEKIEYKACEYFKRKFPNKIREMKIRKYLGGVA